MAQLRRPRLWLLLALAAMLAAAVLWLRGTLPHESSHSPPPTPSDQVTSLLSTPTPANATAVPPPAWADSGAALVWVGMGTVLALGVVLLILRRHRHDT